MITSSKGQFENFRNPELLMFTLHVHLDWFQTLEDYQEPVQILLGIKEIESLNLKLIENLSETEETNNETGKVSAEKIV